MIAFAEEPNIFDFIKPTEKNIEKNVNLEWLTMLKDNFNITAHNSHDAVDAIAHYVYMEKQK